MAKEVQIIVSAKDAASEAFKKMGLEAEATSRKFQDFGSKLTGAGTAMTAGVTAPIVGVGAAALKMSTDFNAAMANIASLIPNSAKRVDELKKGIQDLAVETGKSTQDLADGMYEVISAFGDGAASMDVLKVAAKSAVAGVAGTKESINMLSAVIKGYGLDMKDAAKVSDLAFTAVKIGQTTFGELASSIGGVVPMAKALGVSQEELWGQMATLTGVTGNTSEVVTQLRATYQAVLKPTTDMAEAIKRLALPMIEQGKISGPLVDEYMRLSKAMVEVGTKIDDMEKAGKKDGLSKLKKQADDLSKAMLDTAAGLGSTLVGAYGGVNNLISALGNEAGGNSNVLGKMFGSVEAINAVLAMSGAQADALAKNTKAMYDVTGATSTAFNEQTNGINQTGFTMGQFQQQLAVVAQTLGDSLAPALKAALDAAKPLIDGLSGLAKWFADLPAPVQTFIVAIGGIAAAIGPVLLVVGSLSTGWGALMGGISAVTGVLPALGPLFSALTGPVGLVVAAVAGLSAAWMLWGDDITKFFKEKIIPFFANTWDSIKETTVKAWNGVKSFITDVASEIMGAFTGAFKLDKVMPAIEDTGKAIGKGLRGAYQWAQGGVNAASEFISGLADNVEGAVTKLKDIGTTIGSTIWESIKKAFTKAKDFILQIISNMIPDNAAGDLIRKGFETIGLHLPAVKKMQQGGILPGFGGGDIVPAMLEPGEAVIPKDSVVKWRGLVKALIGGGKKYEDGGFVPFFFDDGTMIAPPGPDFSRDEDDEAGTEERRQKYRNFRFGPELLSVGMFPRTGLDEVVNLFRELSGVSNLQASYIAKRIQEKLAAFSPVDILLGLVEGYGPPSGAHKNRAGIGAIALALSAISKIGTTPRDEDQIKPENFAFGMPGYSPTGDVAGYTLPDEQRAYYPIANPDWGTVIHEQTHKYQEGLRELAASKNISIASYQDIYNSRFGKADAYFGHPYEVEARFAEKAAVEAMWLARDVISAGHGALLSKILGLVGGDTLSVWRSAFPELRLKSGGLLAGFGGGDIVPAMLEPGEAVIPKESVSRWPGLIKSLITGGHKFADGGVVGALAGKLAAPIMNSPVVSNVMSGIQTGMAAGPMGALAGALTGLLASSKSFASLMEKINPILQSVADAFGKIIDPLLPLVDVIGQVLTPILDVMGTILAQSLMPLMPILFEGIKIIGLGFMHAAEYVAMFRNKILEFIQGIFRGLGSIEVFGKKLFGGLNDAADSLEKYKVNTDEIQDAIKTLEETTWESVLAKQKENEATEEVTESMKNVPNMFKAILARAQAADAASLESSAGAVATRGIRVPGTSKQGEPATYTFNVTVQDGRNIDANKRAVQEGVMDVLNKLGLMRTGTLAVSRR